MASPHDKEKGEAVDNAPVEIDIALSDADGSDDLAASGAPVVAPTAPAPPAPEGPRPTRRDSAKGPEPKRDFMLRLMSAATQHRGNFILSLVFFVLGVVLHGVAIGCLAHCAHKSHAAIFIVPGALLIMPGFYGLMTFVQYARRVPGYDPRSLADRFHSV